MLYPRRCVRGQERAASQLPLDNGKVACSSLQHTPMLVVDTELYALPFHPESRNTYELSYPQACLGGTVSSVPL